VLPKFVPNLAALVPALSHPLLRSVARYRALSPVIALCRPLPRSAASETSRRVQTRTRTWYQYSVTTDVSICAPLFTDFYSATKCFVFGPFRDQSDFHAEIDSFVLCAVRASLRCWAAGLRAPQFLGFTCKYRPARHLSKAFLQISDFTPCPPPDYNAGQFCTKLPSNDRNVINYFFSPPNLPKRRSQRHRSPRYSASLQNITLK
jgi:hypothetical protein